MLRRVYLVTYNITEALNSLGYKQFLGVMPAGKIGVLFDLYGEGALPESGVCVTGVGTRSGPTLEGLPVIKKKM